MDDIKRTGMLLKMGTRFSSKEFGKWAGIDVIYNDEKKRKDFYRSINEYLKLLHIKGWISVVENDREIGKKSKGRTPLMYECRVDLDLTSTFPIIRKIDQRLICRHCHMEFEMAQKPQFCPFCKSKW